MTIEARASRRDLTPTAQDLVCTQASQYMERRREWAA